MPIIRTTEGHRKIPLEDTLEMHSIVIAPGLAKSLSGELDL